MVAFLIILQFETHEQIMNLNYQEEAYQRISNAVNLASQDAVEQVTPESVSNGQPIFDTTQADAVFRQDLGMNLDLDPTTLAPGPSSQFNVAPTIVTEQFIDWSNETFPYQFVNPQYGIDTTLNDASIFYVLQFTIPSVDSNVKPFTITVPMIQSYQGS